MSPLHPGRVEPFGASAGGAHRFAPVLLVVALALIVLALGACGGGGDEEGEGAAGEEPAASSAEGECEAAEASSPKKVNLDPPPPKPSAPKLTAVVATSCGSFDISLDTRRNPKTAASFEYLAENGVFDGTPFHRIVPGFVIQAGDPAGTGSGPGPGYSVDEPPPSDTAYTKGVVAMAKTEIEPPGRSGSQFFVVTAADAGLPADFAVAGEVSAGMEVVDRIAELGDPASGGTGVPLQVVVIDSVTIEER